MFAGKTSELIKIFNESKPGSVVCFKPRKDDRYSNDDFIVNHLGEKIPCTLIDNPTEIRGKTPPGCRTIIIDEVQFFEPVSTVMIIQEMLWHPYQEQDVVVAGVNFDFKGNMFPTTKLLLTLTDNIKTLTGKCNCNGFNPTERTIRKDSTLDEQIVVGGLELYEAVCMSCFNDHQQKYQVQ